MAKKKPRILFNPKVGMQYFITDLEKDEEIVCSTLCDRDKDQKPYRTPKGTEPGEEFFKVKIGSKKSGGFTIIKLMNSISLDKCLSDCGRYEFTGRRPNGNHISANNVNSKENALNESKVMDIIEEKTEEIKEEIVEENSKEVITVDVLSNEFSDPKELKNLFSKSTGK